MVYVNDDELVMAQVLFRHGKRNIGAPYKNDPYNNEDLHWKGGYGQLTTDGRRQMHEFGQFLRRRYDSILGKEYSTKKLYCQSTDFDRTIMSAQLCLAGLYPPTEKDRWSDDIDWNPIPVHTIPWMLDHVLTTGRNCEVFEAARTEFLDTSPEVRRVFTEHADLLDHWRQKSGMPLVLLDEVFELYNTILTEQEHNKSLEKWAEEAIVPGGPMEYMSLLFFLSYSATRQLARLKAGFLIREIMDHFQKKTDGTLKPDRSIWLYSAHDLHIVNVLNALRVYEQPHFPPCSASLHFELYKDKKDGSHYFQFFYRKEEEEHPKPISIPGCGDRCTVRQFIHVFKDVIPDEFEKECCMENATKGAV